mmetsp:Transcript_104951/g.297087  ORF Transcript_104951/g.297087 Transcript_104951/m.297087 type:complete len:311 (-) Transcript_104951:44-976(-)
MFGKSDPVHGRVPQVHVGVRHVDLRPQQKGPLGVFALLHLRKEPQILLHSPVSEWRVYARLVLRAPTSVLLHVLGRLGVHVRLPCLDEIDGERVHLVEIIAGEEQRVTPRLAAILALLEVECLRDPTHVILDGLDVLRLLRLRVGIVKPQVALSVVLLREPKICQNRLRVANVQIPIRLWREPGNNFLAVTPAARRQVLVDPLLQKVFVRSRDRGRVAGRPSSASGGLGPRLRTCRCRLGLRRRRRWRARGPVFGEPQLHHGSPERQADSGKVLRVHGSDPSGSHAPRPAALASRHCRCTNTSWHWLGSS